MVESFTIETTTDTLKADAKGSAKATFIVINATSHPTRGLATAKALGDTKREWLSIAGETERDFGSGGKERFTVNFDAASAPAGKYQFRLDIASVLDPDEDFRHGPTVTVEVYSYPPPQKAPPTLFYLLGCLLMLAVAGVAGYIAYRLLFASAL